MIRFFKYNLNSDFELNKETLNKLNNYVALSQDNQLIHYKPLPIILNITTNNSGTEINKRTDSGFETVILNNGENKLTDWKYGFYFGNMKKQDQITSFDLSKYNTSNVTNMGYMFYKCNKLTSLNVSKFDTSNVTDMQSMFESCSNLTSLDVSNFNTSKVTDMNYLFANCLSLTSLDLSSFDTSNVTDMSDMFTFCETLTVLNINYFNTSNVTNISEIFFNCTNLISLDVSSFDISKVTNMKDMFFNCNKLTHIKCKQSFKNWCLTNQDTIYLPTAMRNSGSGHWEIID